MRYVMHEGELIPKHLAPRSPPAARSDLPAPAIIGDIQPYESMITGEQVTTRGRHNEILKEHGYNEVGDDTPDWMKERRYMRKHDEPVPDQVKNMGVEDNADAPFEWVEPDSDLLADLDDE